MAYQAFQKLSNYLLCSLTVTPFERPIRYMDLYFFSREPHKALGRAGLGELNATGFMLANCWRTEPEAAV